MGGEVETMVGFMEKYGKVLAPYVKGGSSEAGKKVGGWEVHVDETPRELWRTDGLRPPMREGEEEVLGVWMREDRAVPYEKL
jgi:hypothetical protein